MTKNLVQVGAPVLTTQVVSTLSSSCVREPGQPYGVLTRDELTRKASGLSPVENDRYLRTKTLEHIANNPDTGGPRSTPQRNTLKTVYFFAPLDWEIIGDRAVNYWYLVMFPLALGGFLLHSRHHRGLLLPTRLSHEG